MENDTIDTGPGSTQFPDEAAQPEPPQPETGPFPSGAAVPESGEAPPPTAVWQWASPLPYGAGTEVPPGGAVPGQWGSWSWGPTPPAPPRPHRRLLAAAAFAGVFIVAGAAGLGARVAFWPSSSPRTSSTLTPSTPNGSGSTANGGSGAGSGGGSSSSNSGSGSGSSSLTSSIIAGVVDVNVTLADGAGEAAGTGMVITSSGEVLTNNHVIDGAQSITVQVAGTGPTYSAHVLGYDVSADIALLQVDGAPSLSTVNLGDSATVSVGDAVTAVGNALGRSGPPSVTSGSVTALDQQITASDQNGANAETLTGLIQTNAPIQPGDSGGPLVNTQNQVVGMDTAAAAGGGRFRIRQSGSRVAYAIPIDAAMTIVHEIQAGGGGDSNVQTGNRAFLGVGTQAGSGAGAQVTSVQSGSPAEGAGIGVGDVITTFDGSSVSSPDELRAAILKHHPGDHATVSWQDSSGGQHTATVTLSSGPPA